MWNEPTGGYSLAWAVVKQLQTSRERKGWGQGEFSEVEAKERNGRYTWSERTENKGERESSGGKDSDQLIWRKRGGRKGREEDDRERGERMRDVRDMAHLPLLSGCCEIAGFPRSAKCGSEFFPCLSPLHSLSSPSSVLHFLPHAHRLPPSLSLPRHWAMD